MRRLWAWLCDWWHGRGYCWIQTREDVPEAPDIARCPNCGEPFGPYMWRGLVAKAFVPDSGGAVDQYMESSEERHCRECGQTSITRWRGWPEERPEKCEFVCLN